MPAIMHGFHLDNNNQKFCLKILLGSNLNQSPLVFALLLVFNKFFEFWIKEDQALVE